MPYIHKMGNIRVNTTDTRLILFHSHPSPVTIQLIAV